MNELDSIRNLANIGQKVPAMQQLAIFLRANPRHLEAWFLMAQLVDDPSKKSDCYQHVLQLDPGNPLAEQALREMLQSVLPPVEAPASPQTPTETPAEPAAFSSADLSSGADDGSELPPRPTTPARRKRPRKPRFGVGVRIGGTMIILAILGFIIYRSALNMQRFQPGTPTPFPPTETMVPTLTARSVTLQPTFTPTPSATPSPTLEITPLTIGETETALAYSGSGQVFLWQSDGTSVSLNQSTQPVTAMQFSPDGVSLAFLRHGDLWMIDTTDGLETLLASPTLLDITLGANETPQIASFVWLPDSSGLLFSAAVVNQSTLVSYPAGVFRASPDSPARRIIEGAGGELTISPDGELLAMAQPNVLLLANLDGSDLRTALTYNIAYIDETIPYTPHVVWLANSNTLLLATLPAQDGAGGVIWQVPVDGNPVSPLSEDDTLTTPPVMAADGSALAWTDGDPGTIWVQSLPDGAPQYLAGRTPGSILGWSPAGGLVYTLRGDIHIYVATSTGLEPSTLTELPDGDWTQLRILWLTDDQFILTGNDGENTHLWFGQADQPLQLISVDILALAQP